ncbi:hypothetical protein ACRAWF_34700 [Streptomyces sp. L7]
MRPTDPGGGTRRRLRQALLEAAALRWFTRLGHDLHATLQGGGPPTSGSNLALIKRYFGLEGRWLFKAALASTPRFLGPGG